MTARAKRGLKFAAAAILAALLVALTVNVAVDFWTPQAELKQPLATTATPAVEPAALQIPQPITPPAPALPEQPAASTAQPWNQPLFEPKFDAPGVARSANGAQGFTAPDFSSALNQYAPLPQVLPPSVSLSGSDPAPVSIRPIFGTRSGGVDGALGGLPGGAGGLVTGAGGTVSGATSSASSLLKR